MRGLISTTLILLLVLSILPPILPTTLQAEAQTLQPPILIAPQNGSRIALTVETIDPTNETVHMYSVAAWQGYNTVNNTYNNYTLTVYEYVYVNTSTGAAVATEIIHQDYYIYGDESIYLAGYDIHASSGLVACALFLSDGVVYLTYSTAYGAPGTWTPSLINLTGQIEYGRLVPDSDLYNAHVLGYPQVPRVYAWSNIYGQFIVFTGANSIWLYDPQTSGVNSLLILNRVNNTAQTNPQPGDTYYIEHIVVDVLPLINGSLYAVTWGENAVWAQDASGNLYLSRNNWTSIIRIDYTSAVPTIINMTTIPGSTTYSRLSYDYNRSIVGMLTNQTGAPGILYPNGTTRTIQLPLLSQYPLPVYFQADFIVVSGLALDPNTNAFQQAIEVFLYDQATGSYQPINQTPLPLQTPTGDPTLIPSDYAFETGSLGYYEAVELARADKVVVQDISPDYILVNFPLKQLKQASGTGSTQPGTGSPPQITVYRDSRLLTLNSTIVSYRPLAAGYVPSWHPGYPNGYGQVIVLRVENSQAGDTGFAVVGFLVDGNNNLVVKPTLLANMTINLDPYDAVILGPGTLHPNLTILLTGVDSRGYGCIYEWQLGSSSPTLIYNSSAQQVIMEAEPFIYGTSSTGVNSVELVLVLDNMSLWHLKLDSQGGITINKTSLILPASGTTWSISYYNRWSFTGSDIPSSQIVQSFYMYAVIYDQTTATSQLALLQWDVYFSDSTFQITDVVGPTVFVVAPQQLAQQVDTIMIASAITPNPLDSTSKALVNLYTNTTTGLILGTSISQYFTQSGQPPTLSLTFNTTGVVIVAPLQIYDPTTNTTSIALLGGYTSTGQPPLQPAILDPSTLTPIGWANTTSGYRILIAGHQLSNTTIILYEAGHGSPWSLTSYTAEPQAPTPIPEPWIVPLIALAGGAIYLLTRRPRRQGLIAEQAHG